MLACELTVGQSPVLTCHKPGLWRQEDLQSPYRRGLRRALEGGILTSVFAHIGMVVELVNEQRPLLPQGVQLSLRRGIAALRRSARALQTLPD